MVLSINKPCLAGCRGARPHGTQRQTYQRATAAPPHDTQAVPEGTATYGSLVLLIFVYITVDTNVTTENPPKNTARPSPTCHHSPPGCNQLRPRVEPARAAPSSKLSESNPNKLVILLCSFRLICYEINPCIMKHDSIIFR